MPTKLDCIAPVERTFSIVRYQTGFVVRQEAAVPGGTATSGRISSLAFGRELDAVAWATGQFRILPFQWRRLPDGSLMYKELGVARI